MLLNWAVTALETEGLFRRSATASLLTHVQQQFNSGICCHDSVTKLYLINRLMLKNCRFNASVTMTLIKRRKRQKLVYCIFACKNFLSSLHYVRRWWHSVMMTRSVKAVRMQSEKLRRKGFVKQMISNLGWMPFDNLTKHGPQYRKPLSSVFLPHIIHGSRYQCQGSFSFSTLILLVGSFDL